MKKLNLIMLIMLSTGVISTSYAIGQESNTISKASASSTDSSTKFSIPANAPLSVDLLDKCWANREDLSNQAIIADYLMTQPKLPQDYEITWKTARLVYFIGNYGIGENKYVGTTAGVGLFNYGVNAGKIAKQLNPNKVEGNYWYAVDLGSYGLAKGILSSASNAKYGMAALKVAMSLNPEYDNYGSYRVLGKYYQELPGIFGGDKTKAYGLLSNAVKSAPSLSNNWVFLGQFYISQSDYSNAIIACNKALSAPSSAGKYEELRYRREARKCVSLAQSKQ